MKTEANETAYPIIGSNVNDIREVEVKESGLTKREYFAALAMQGYCAHRYTPHQNEKGVAEYSVKLADALIEALNK